MHIRETAYAKINLALHVRKRRDDGYHELETLFAFVDAGDDLAVEVARSDSLAITGPFADGLSNGPDNLVLRAVEEMRRLGLAGNAPVPPLAITLDKRLPVAAGIGGGSADAGAVIRVINRNFGGNGDIDRLVLATRDLGADVGACIVSETRIGTGLGWDLQEPEIDDLKRTPVLLVNPRIPLFTGPVFKAWDGIDLGPLPHGTAREIALAGRNDLEKPAIGLCPEIATMLAALRATGPMLARMSGSGATCFALYDSIAARDNARQSLPAGWWTLAGRLR